MPVASWRKWWEKMRRRTLIRQETQVVFSTALEREVTVDFYYPKRLPRQPLRLCICQDGQDVRRMNLPQILAQLWREGYPPLLFVAVHANADRMQEYGTYARVDYMGRGARSPLYVDFVRHELLPLLTEKFTISTDPRHRTVAGFSLGALPAFDLAWHFPQTFGQVGVFSGALWWRAAKFNPQDPDANRILHLQVAQSVTVPAVRYWFQTGTEDETEDRNNNGIIDAIDDTLDLIAELEKKGHRREVDLIYYEVTGGRHEPATWAAAMPHFLRWTLTAPFGGGKENQ